MIEASAAERRFIFPALPHPRALFVFHRKKYAMHNLSSEGEYSMFRMNPRFQQMHIKLRQTKSQNGSSDSHFGRASEFFNHSLSKFIFQLQLLLYLYRELRSI
jgi:hypothetical protein